MSFVSSQISGSKGSQEPQEPGTKKTTFNLILCFSVFSLEEQEKSLFQRFQLLLSTMWDSSRPEVKAAPEVWTMCCYKTSEEEEGFLTLHFKGSVSLFSVGGAKSHLPSLCWMTHQGMCKQVLYLALGVYFQAHPMWFSASLAETTECFKDFDTVQKNARLPRRQ